MSLLTDQRQAVAAAQSRDTRHAMSSDQFARLKAWLLSDSYAFTEVICGHQDLIPEFHAPLSYAFTGSTAKLVECLNDPAFDSYSTQVIKRELKRREIDWNTPEGFWALDSLLDILYFCIYRGSFKSSVGTHGGVTYWHTVDPDETTWLVSNSDPNAWAFCDQIGKTLLSGNYADFFPERIPTGNRNELVTNSRITFGGRSISSPQTNIEADGYLTKRVSAHFSTFVVDDITAKENGNATGIKGVNAWLSGMTGFEMATRRVRRRHEGTIYEESDYKFLTSGDLFNDCLTIFIPIEVHEGGRVENIRERGTPTNPKLHSVEKIQKLQSKTLSGEQGASEWRWNYLLDNEAGGARMFPEHILNDPERSWTFVQHPDPKMRLKQRFLVRRVARDKESRILNTKGHPLFDLDDVKKEVPRGTPRLLTFDPWKHLDRVLILDPGWVEGGDNWALSCVGQDYDGVQLQLETRSDDDGKEGWLDALPEMVKFWEPRYIGFDGNGLQDDYMQTLLRTDPRIKKLRGRIHAVPHTSRQKPARIKQGLAEPLRQYMFLLDPREATGRATKDEARDYKGGKNAVDGILDSLSMAPVALKSKRKPEEADEIERRRRAVEAAYTRSVDRYVGVPLVA